MKDKKKFFLLIAILANNINFIKSSFLNSYVVYCFYNQSSATNGKAIIYTLESNELNIQSVDLNSRYVQSPTFSFNLFNQTTNIFKLELIQKTVAPNFNAAGYNPSAVNIQYLFQPLLNINNNKQNLHIIGCKVNLNGTDVNEVISCKLTTQELNITGDYTIPENLCMQTNLYPQ